MYSKATPKFMHIALWTGSDTLGRQSTTKKSSISAPVSYVRHYVPYYHDLMTHTSRTAYTPLWNIIACSITDFAFVDRYLAAKS